MNAIAHNRPSSSRMFMHAVLIGAGTLFVAGCSTTPRQTTMATAPVAASDASMRAGANLAASSGSLVSGKLMLMPMNGGVHFTGEVGGLAPNSTHGIHVHERGDCSAADASSAGDHFNPTGAAHGKAGVATHHAGDMDNITANAAGVARVNMHLDGVTMGSRAANDVIGRAVVVHAVADDYRSQPAGNAGARVACGVVAVMR